MALTLNTDNNEIKIISSKDESVHCTPEVYQEYLKTLDESVLELDGEPTRFVIRKVLPYKQNEELKKQQMTIKTDMKSRTVTPELNTAYQLFELRACLVGIDGPGLQFKKGDDGLVDRELVSLLDQSGIADELMSARLYSMRGVNAMDQKKD